ncbi:hypothetical protein ACFVXG_29780 [Kitasatospora sp. NPDC058162]|uniref:hypothetical protein n=1 Tax=Kitasatospora sp. NPDC058162 TaxID=3346362 RepID=UPI0036DB58AF
MREKRGSERERRSLGHWTATAVLTIVGVGCLGAVVHMERQDLALDHHGVHTTATIVQVRKEPRTTSYLLRFGPADRTPSDTWTKDVNGSVGSVVDVVYDPENPGGVAGTDALSNHEWIIPCLFVPAGSVVLAMAWVVSRRKQGA